MPRRWTRGRECSRTVNGVPETTAADAWRASRSCGSAPPLVNSCTRGAPCCCTTCVTSCAISGRSVARSPRPRKTSLPCANARELNAWFALTAVASVCTRTGETSTPSEPEIAEATGFGNGAPPDEGERPAGAGSGGGLRGAGVLCAVLANRHHQRPERADRSGLAVLAPHRQLDVQRREHAA